MAWVEAVPFAALEHDAMVSIELRGTRVALARVGDAPAAFRDECTHERCDLSDGYLEGDRVECPCHGAVFDVLTGEVVAGPAAVSLTVYPTSVAAGIVSIELP